MDTEFWDRQKGFADHEIVLSCYSILNKDNSGCLYEADPISALCSTGSVFIYANIRMRSGSMNSAINVQEYLLLFCWISFSYIFTNSIFFVIDVFIYLIDPHIFAEVTGVAWSQDSIYTESSKICLAYTF